LLLQPAVERGGRRLVAPCVVPAGVFSPAQQLLLNWGQPAEPVVALSRCIEPSGPREPALAMWVYTRSTASRAAAASSERSAPRMIR